MVDIDRMIHWLVELVQDSHLSSCLCSRCEDGIAEVVLGNHLRATESEENAAMLDALQSLRPEEYAALADKVRRIREVIAK